jgi:hypothetical protein
LISEGNEEPKYKNSIEWLLALIVVVKPRKVYMTNLNVKKRIVVVCDRSRDRI